MYVFCSGPQNELSSNTSSRVSCGAPGAAAARLVVTQLVPVVQKLFVAGLATSTKRVYATGYKRYTTFCDCTQLAPFPASESTLQLFVSYLHQEGLSFGTIKSYLAAIRFEQIAQNLGNPNIHLMSHLDWKESNAPLLPTAIHVSPSHQKYSSVCVRFGNSSPTNKMRKCYGQPPTYASLAS